MEWREDIELLLGSQARPCRLAGFEEEHLSMPSWHMAAGRRPSMVRVHVEHCGPSSFSPHLG